MHKACKKEGLAFPFSMFKKLYACRESREGGRENAERVKEYGKFGKAESVRE